MSYNMSTKLDIKKKCEILSRFIFCYTLSIFAPARRRQKPSLAGALLGIPTVLLFMTRYSEITRLFRDNS